MLFHKFKTQEERREFGGSDFIEFQYCLLPQNTITEQIFTTGSIQHWKNDSLYVYGDDLEIFLTHYGEIITDGLYANLKQGYIDPLGINFYTQEQINHFIQLIEIKKPLEYQTLLNWLNNGKHYIGFYILGE